MSTTEDSILAVIRASRPSFRDGKHSDKIAFAIHASFMAAGYSLLATAKNAFSDNPPTDGEEVGIEGWNELDDSYGFVYSKIENNLQKVILVKCLPIGDTLMVDVLNLKEENMEPLHLQINVKDHLSDEKSNYREMYKNLQGLLEKINTGIFKQLEPKVTASSSSGAGKSKRSTDKEPQPLPHGDISPGDGASATVYPDMYVMQQAELLHQIVYPPVQPSPYSDVFPSPGAGVFPVRGPPIGGPMLVGPNDPRWFGQGEIPRPGRAPGCPPGARFDPYGPPDVPGFEPERFIRRLPRRPGDTHPDLEHFGGGSDYI